MEILNLGESIAQLKVLKWQYEECMDPKDRKKITKRILELIDLIEIPELIGSEMGEL